MIRTAAAVLVSIAVPIALAAAPVTGELRDEAGAAVEGAAVCFVNGAEEGECTRSDRFGRFELPDAELDTLRVSARGFLPLRVSRSQADRPIVLRRTPVLKVRLIDAASGDPIDEGEVLVVYASGRRKGPFPVKRAGLRVRRGLPPGEVVLQALAEGYEAATFAATLEAGDETDVVMRLTAAP